MDLKKLFEVNHDVDVKIPGLKRCPFCNGDAAILHYLGDGYLPHCSNCDGMIEKWFETPEEALDAWNRRVNNQ